MIWGGLVRKRYQPWGKEGLGGMKKAIVVVLVLSMLVIPPTISGCSSPGDFSIYLTKDDIPVSKIPVLSHVEIADEPIVSIKDIVSYTRDTHEIELTAKAYERVMDLKVPTSGKSFVVCINKSPIYWGAFWVPYSSQSFDGVTILVPAFSEQENTVKIELGYPSASFYTGDDPRSSREIMKSLEKAGKLK
jgi:hypothetical protein